MTPPTGVAPRRGGALRLIEERTTHPSTVDLTGYLHRAAKHCPYLAPSQARGLTAWTVYRAETPDERALEAAVFAAAVTAAENVRLLMRQPHGALRCENVAVLGLDPRRDGVLAWPHWATKNLYGPVGIMVGKFAAGEERTDGRGRSIPPPPVSFLPVRAAIRARDPRFLAATPDLAEALAVAVAVDDGHDVFAANGLTHDWEDIRTWAAHLRSRPAPRRPSPPPATPAESR